MKISGSWLEKDGVLAYIIDCYVGVEKTPRRGRPRRVFQWVENGQVMKGNAEAFILHMGLKFGLSLSTSTASMIHAILRELGEVVIPTKKERAKRDPDGPGAGKFRQPSPEKWRAR